MFHNTMIIFTVLLALFIFRNVERKYKTGVLCSLLIVIAFYFLEPDIVMQNANLIVLGYVIVLANAVKKTLRQIGHVVDFVLGNVPKTDKNVVNILSDATKELSHTQTGAIIALMPNGVEPDTNILSGGTVIDGKVSVELLLSIFRKGTALHDGIVCLSGKTLYSAGSVATTLPTSQELPNEFDDSHLRTRHRAGYNISFYYPVITVSEETGDVHIMRNGYLKKVDSEKEFKEILTKNFD